MDVIIGILGAAAIILGFWFLIISAARRRLGGQRAMICVAAMVAGVAFLAAAWGLNMTTSGPEATVNTPPAIVSVPVEGPNEMTGLVAVSLTFATAVGTGILWWLAFGLIPGMLSRLRLKHMAPSQHLHGNIEKNT